MSGVSIDLVNFMIKWSGKSGSLVLVNIVSKLGIRNLEDMTEEEKEKLLNALTGDYLSNFLGHSRFLMARSELISILGLKDSYRVRDTSYRRPRSPNLFGKPKA